MAWTSRLVRQVDRHARISRHSRYWVRKATRHTQAQILERRAELESGSRCLPEPMQLSSGDQAAGARVAWTLCPGPAETCCWRKNKTPHIERPSYLGQSNPGFSEVESGRTCSAGSRRGRAASRGRLGGCGRRLSEWCKVKSRC